MRTVRFPPNPPDQFLVRATAGVKNETVASATIARVVTEEVVRSTADPATQAFLSPVLHAALSYAARRLHVFPCRAGGKNPAISGGFHRASTDSVSIRAMFDNPNYNIGIATGASGLVVIDVDGDIGRASFEALKRAGDIPPTYSVTTRSGGHHYYFKAPAGVEIKCSQCKLGKKIDVRAEGGYVIAPPSWVEADKKGPGGAYKIEIDLPIVALPDWIAAKLVSAPKLQASDEKLSGSDDTAAIARKEFPPTSENIEKIKRALQLRVAAGGWEIEERWFQTLLEMRSLHMLAGWPETLAWKLFDDWCQVVGGVYDLIYNRGRWDHYDRTVSNPRTYRSLLYQIASTGLSTPTVAAMLPPTVSASAIPTTAPARFRLRTVAELRALPPAKWRVQDILPEQGLACIYGPSMSGKTFLALDCAAHIALGGNWFGCSTTACPVVYVALEGQQRIGDRLTAWETHWKRTIPSTLRVVTDHLSLFEHDDIEEFARAIVLAGLDKGVIIIDTVNQSAPEADENTSKDMGRIIAIAKRLQELTRSLVILVHHSGKDLGRGLRGHSSLLAALDAAIEVKRDQNGHTWTLAKNKDGQDRMTSGFQLPVVIVRKNPDGTTASSCAVNPSIHQIFNINMNNKSKTPRGKLQTLAFREITRLLQASLAIPPGSAQKLKYDDAERATVAALIDVPPKRRRDRAAEAIDGLVNGGFLSRNGDQLSFPELHCPGSPTPS